MLVSVRDRRTVVADVAEAIEILIRLVRVRDRGTIVTGVADAVQVLVRLIRVRNRRTVVDGVRDSVTIAIRILEGDVARHGAPGLTTGDQPQSQIGTAHLGPVEWNRHRGRAPAGGGRGQCSAPGGGS